jgi:DNA polymerase-3 subunit delta'
MALFPWLNNGYQQLTHLVSEDRLPHALLLSSAGGLGIQSLAEALAATILCLAPTPTAQGAHACGTCKSCLLVTNGSHPDYRVVSHREGKKQIAVDDVRDAMHFLQQTAQQGHHKVLVITPAETLNKASANALLKSLEEPPAGTFLILLSDRPASLLATIRSRCFKHAIATPDHETSHQWLSGNIQDPETVNLLLSVCNDRPCEALRFYEQGSLDIRSKLIEDLNKLMGKHLGPSEIAGRWNKLPMDQVLFWLSLWLTDMSRFLGSKGLVTLRDPMMVKITKYTVRHAKAVSIFGLTDDILSYKSGLERQTNLNPQLVLEEILITWHDMIF